MSVLVGKLTDDIPETMVRAITRGVGRYIGFGSGLVFFLTQRRNDVLAAQFRRLCGPTWQEARSGGGGSFDLGSRVHLLKNGKFYSELGGNYFDSLQPERLTRYHVKRLERVGYKLTLERCTA